MEEDNPQTLECAHAEFKKRNFKRAEELYTRFISSCVKFRGCEASSLAAAYNNRGQIKYFRVEFDDAVEDFTSAIQTDGRFEVAFYNRGLIRYRLALDGAVYSLMVLMLMPPSFFDDAKSDFQQALKLNPDFEDAKVSLHQTLLDQQHKMKRGY